MEYKEFVETVKGEIRKRLQGECDVTVKTDLRDNGVLADILSIQPLKGASGAASVVPLRRYYRQYMSSQELEACVETILRNFREENAILESYGFGADTVPWENIRELVYPVLLSTKKNWFLLESLVSRPVLDLSVTYIIRMKIQQGEPPLFTRITERLFDTWRISEEQLYQTAMENLQKETPVLIDMDSLSGLVPTGERPERIEKGKSYILSNPAWYYGTSMLLNIKYLRKISGGSSFYILPMTIHELALVGVSERTKAESMNAMAARGNEEVGVEYRFQDHAYYFDAETGEVTSCV